MPLLRGVSSTFFFFSGASSSSSLPDLVLSAFSFSSAASALALSLQIWHSPQSSFRRQASHFLQSRNLTFFLISGASSSSSSASFFLFFSGASSSSSSSLSLPDLEPSRFLFFLLWSVEHHMNNSIIVLNNSQTSTLAYYSTARRRHLLRCRRFLNASASDSSCSSDCGVYSLHTSQLPTLKLISWFGLQAVIWFRHKIFKFSKKAFGT